MGALKLMGLLEELLAMDPLVPHLDSEPTICTFVPISRVLQFEILESG